MSSSWTAGSGIVRVLIGRHDRSLCVSSNVRFQLSGRKARRQASQLIETDHDWSKDTYLSSWMRALLYFCSLIAFLDTVTKDKRERTARILNLKLVRWFISITLTLSVIPVKCNYFYVQSSYFFRGATFEL